MEDDYFVSDMEKVETLIKELEKGDENTTEELEALIKEPETSDEDPSKELEVTEDERLKVNVDNDGEGEIVDMFVDKFANKNCKCCCVSHCTMTAHTACTGVVYGVSLAKYIVTPAALEMPYTREKVLPGDEMIRPTIALESTDEMYDSLTALQTDFNIL